MKKMNLACVGMLGAGLALVGCGSDSSSDSISMSDSFEIVLDKSNYTYNSKDSLFIIKAPVCKQSTLGDLVWARESDIHDTSFVYTKGEKADKAYICDQDGKDCETYVFDGKKFPKGFYIDPDDSKNNIRYATHVEKSVVKDVFQYDGNCFAQSYYSQLMEGNYAMEDADDALSDLYSKFLADPEDLDEEAMVKDFRAPDCNRLTMFNGDVSVSMNDFTTSGGKIVLKYKKKSCNITFKIRYAYNEKDCKAAFDEFSAENGKNKEAKFEFYDYGEYVDYDIYCVNGMVNALQRDRKVLGKETAADASALPKSVVKFIVNGMKK